MSPESSRRANRHYWIAVLLLVALGSLSIFSVGMFLWATAIALTMLAPFRSRPRVFLPGLALFLGLLVGYVLFAPWSCSQSFSSDPDTGEETLSPVVCTSPIGVEYSGPQPFEPDRVPALLTGVVTGVGAAVVTWLTVRSKHDREPSLSDD